MSDTIYAPHKTDAAKLAEVVSEMQRLGSPTVRAYYNGEVWMAIEGSHRIAAAAQLGLPVNVIEVGYDDEITGHDLQDLPEIATVAEIVDYLYSRPEAVYSITVE